MLVSTSPSGHGEGALTIEVTGRQFWWEVRYPDHGVVTANEIHIPSGETIRFRVTSADVIHSFWIPRLMKETAKLDELAGRDRDDGRSDDRS